MWASNSAPKEAGTSSKRGVPAQGGSQNQDFRVVERVAYAHPVRDHQMYYAPKGNNQYEQRQPPPIPPHPNNHGVGYPYYSAPQPQYEGRARVRRGVEHNSECVLFDPSESVVVSKFSRQIERSCLLFGLWIMSFDEIFWSFDNFAKSFGKLVKWQ